MNFDKDMKTAPSSSLILALDVPLLSFRIAEQLVSSFLLKSRVTLFCGIGR
ncbi:MAG TPA: hypothetical protein PLP17_09330 [Oligoflexia bacterium]|nr:hypothetical protein [Oligoflexia bacterium]